MWRKIRRGARWLLATLVAALLLLAFANAREAFAAAWDQEGRLLSQALNAREDAECRRLVTEFLGVRTERRVKSGLSRDLIAMEQEREWLEGLASPSTWRCGAMSRRRRPGRSHRGQRWSNCSLNDKHHPSIPKQGWRVMPYGRVSDSASPSQPDIQHR